MEKREREEIPIRYRGSQFPRQVSPVSLANDLSQNTGPGALANQQRSPALPKCRSLQLEALSAGDVARAPLTAGASYWSSTCNKRNKRRQCGTGQGERAMRLVHFSGCTACVCRCRCTSLQTAKRGIRVLCRPAAARCVCRMWTFAHTCYPFPSIEGDARCCATHPLPF